MKRIFLLLWIILALAYSSVSQTWIQKATMGTYGRKSAMGSVVNDKCYAGLGATTGNTYVNDIWEYDILTNTWAAKPDYPGAGWHDPTSFSIGGKLYVCLGFSNSYACQSDLWEFDPVSNIWTQKANFPGTPRYGSRAFVLGDSAFIVTGSSNNSSLYLSDVYLYIPATNTWKQKANFAGGSRAFGTAFAINGYGYYCAGMSNGYTIKKDFWKYDPNTDSWTAGPDFPGLKRSAPVNFVIGNNAYVCFGDDNPASILYNDYSIYNAVTNSWQAMITATGVPVRSGGFAFSYGLRGFVGVGISTTGVLDDLWSWENLPIVFEQTISKCPGDSVLVCGDYLHVPGTYHDTIIGTITDSIIITHLFDYLVTSPNLGPDTVFCPSQTITLTANIGFSEYLWNTGAIIDSIVVSQPGIYWVQAIDNHGCATFDSIEVTLLQPPSLNIGVDTIVCQGVSVVLQPDAGFNTYLWNTGSTSPVLLVNLSGTYSVTVSNSGNCTGSDSITVMFIPGNIANLPADTGSCMGDTINLTVMNPGIAYIWSTGATTNSIDVSSPGPYMVTVTDTNGCMSPDSIWVSLYPVLEVTADPYMVTICEDSSVVLNAYGALNYAWSPAAGLNATTGSNVIASPSMNTIYHVVGTAAGSCPGDTTISVTVILPPSSSLPDSTLVCTGNSVTLDPGPCDLCTYYWSNGSLNPQIEVSDLGLYWVEIVNEGCKLIDTILVGDCFEIWIPNVFTPNGDGLNETFHPRGIHIQSYKMLIFNRWGEMLFESNDFGQGWDRTFKGKQCPEGVYVYLITFEGLSTGYAREYGRRAGSVTLFR